MVSGGWWHRAACKGEPLETFFPGKGQSSAPAKKICKQCPVATECLEDALLSEPSKHERHGVRAGMAASERDDVFGNRRAS